MRPKKHERMGEGDLFRARLDQIINLKHELAQLAGKIDWDFIDGEIAPLYSDKGRPGIETRFVIGLLLLKHIYGLSDEGVCDRWIYDPYFQHFTGEEFFQHEFPSSPPTPVRRAASSYCTPRRYRATLTMVTRCGPSSRTPRGSPAARSSAPMSTRDTAATMRQTRTVSSFRARSAASSVRSNGNCAGAPPSSPSSVT